MVDHDGGSVPSAAAAGSLPSFLFFFFLLLLLRVWPMLLIVDSPRR